MSVLVPITEYLDLPDVPSRLEDAGGYVSSQIGSGFGGSTLSHDN